MKSRYFDTYEAWKKDPEQFWANAANSIDWIKAWDKVFDPESGPYGRWFTEGQTNTCYNCLDRHVERGRAEQIALIYDSPLAGKKQKFTYAELLEKVAAMAALMARQGIGKGDRVLIYMPMIPEVVVAMLACARVGAIHSVVFGGFAARELAARIEDAQPKLVVAASCGLEPQKIISYKPLLDEAIELSKHKPDTCFILQREECPAVLKEGQDLDLGQLMADALSHDLSHECVPVLATDPLYILYTSGTTGQPKGVLRDNGGHMVALTWSMKNLYDVGVGDVFWAASDVGWVVGHSYIVYAPLLAGATTVLYEGKPVGTPDAGAFWRIISEYSVKSLFTAPTAIRVIKRDDPKAKLLENYKMDSFKSLFLAGEHADPDTVEWASQLLNVPVIDHWWQTETGWCISGNPLGLGMLPAKAGASTLPLPGYDVRILDDHGKEVPAGVLGNILIKLPLPPGCLPTLWQAEQRFEESYLSEFPGYYKTADAGRKDEDGYLYIMSRTDDIINVAGHRLSTGGMEEVLAGHKDVAECAVIGVSDTIKGKIPCGLVVLKSGVERDPSEIEKELVSSVRQKIGAVAAFKIAVTVERLPKTRSGKILRGTMRSIAEGAEYKVPATIDDPIILSEIEAQLKKRGLVGLNKE
ncbi:propionyl-CoA synthetase [Flexibacterium corallicola]|uniref:propionyl-CoA synthetase n=1 Tax=Flexibacterium corallicola TaxID=3037259 RepID=UPI00286FA1E5|nr:propionyl-CoA synthetase [Pseudovibrio sp. M1P-2-3]